MISKIYAAAGLLLVGCSTVSQGDTTDCHACGVAVIRRDWYELKAWNLDDEGSCGECGARCAGRFEGPPGRWGSRRLPVRLADFEVRPETPRAE